MEFCSRAFGRRPRPKVKDAFLKSCLSVAVLNSLADLATKIHFGHETTKHAHAPNINLVDLTESDVMYILLILPLRL